MQHAARGQCLVGHRGVQCRHRPVDRGLVVAALPSGDATLDRIARELATSPRTLRRRLAEDGETFESILSRTRHELALRYLERRDVSLAEIALLLGFSDQSAFQRAFRRWTGETPRAVRERAGHAPMTATVFRPRGTP